MNIASSATSLETLLVKIGAWVQPVVLLLLRLYWGWQFTLTGWSKLTHLSRTAGYFESLHLPLPMVNAIAAGTVECLGGALLTLGLFSRFSAAALSFVMLIAYLTAERAALFGVFGDPETFVQSGPFLYLLTVLIVLAFGPGKLSVDTIVRKKE